MLPDLKTLPNWKPMISRGVLLHFQLSPPIAQYLGWRTWRCMCFDPNDDKLLPVRKILAVTVSFHMNILLSTCLMPATSREANAALKVTELVDGPDLHVLFLHASSKCLGGGVDVIMPADIWPPTHPPFFSFFLQEYYFLKKKINLIFVFLFLTTKPQLVVAAAQKSWKSCPVNQHPVSWVVLCWCVCVCVLLGFLMPQEAANRPRNPRKIASCVL